MPRDYYEILGVPRDASEKEIRSAYRSQARKLHPDVNRDDPGAAQRFKELQQAYDVVGDKEKRQQYDRFGHSFEQFQNGGAQGHPFQFGGDAETGDILSGLFGNLFGGGRGQAHGGAFGFGQAARPRGQDVEVALQLTLEEVESGTTRDVAITIQDICAACEGRGVSRTQQNCSSCHGRGGSRRQEHLKGLKIPAGVDDDAVIKVRGKGGHGPGGDGDLNLRIKVREHAFFSRRGQDLECEVPLSLAEAALGAEILVPTFQGERPLRVPPGTQSGQRFRIKGYGLPDRRSGQPGNLLVKVRVVTPRAVNEAERQLLQSLSQRQGDPRAELWRPPSGATR